MTRYIIGRLGWAVVVLWTLTVVVFGVIHLSGDPTALYVGQEATAQDYAVIRHALGFDRPLLQQYGSFLAHAVRGDFGRSLRFQQPTLPIVLGRLPATLELAVAAIGLAVILAIPLGVFSAVRHGSALDDIGTVLALSGQCMPTFWLGIMLILIFSVQLRWVPIFGTGPLRLVLPAVTLGAWAMARTARITRSSMLEVLRQDYLRTAEAKGLSAATVVLKHALRNGAIPILTSLGLDFGNLLGGAVIVETVFGYPGVGLLSVNAVVGKDIPLIQAVVVVVAAVLVLLNLGIDLLYVVLDPRIRYGSSYGA
ncbi:MAG TPA: ABC transporter permease [bacterium]|nr:ABC transporter permease [bacterium]